MNVPVTPVKTQAPAQTLSTATIAHVWTGMVAKIVRQVSWIQQEADISTFISWRKALQNILYSDSKFDGVSL